MNDPTIQMKKYNNDSEHVMYIVVNTDLAMGKGKIAAQCCHSACHCIRVFERSNRNNQAYMKWAKEGEAKVVLRATEIEMRKMLDMYEVDRVVKRESNDVWCTYVIDCGRTQIPGGSLTTLAFSPVQHSEAPECLRKLKLL